MTVRYHWEHTEVTNLVTDLAKVGPDTAQNVVLIVDENGRALSALWKSNVTKSAGDYAKHYRAAIHSNLKGLGFGKAEAEIQPRPGAKQAGMAFEYGGPSIARKSVGGPIPIGGGRWIKGPGVGQRVGQDKPHLDMNRAADKVFPLFHREIAGEARIPL